MTRTTSAPWRCNCVRARCGTGPARNPLFPRQAGLPVRLGGKPLPVRVVPGQVPAGASGFLREDRRLERGVASAFGDWDFIEVPTGIGPPGGPPAPWVDFRVFMDNQFSAFHGWARNRPPQRIRRARWAPVSREHKPLLRLLLARPVPCAGFRRGRLYAPVPGESTLLCETRILVGRSPSDAASPAEDPFLSWLPGAWPSTASDTVGGQSLGRCEQHAALGWIRPDGAASAPCKRWRLRSPRSGTRWVPSSTPLTGRPQRWESTTAITPGTSAK